MTKIVKVNDLYNEYGGDIYLEQKKRKDPLMHKNGWTSVKDRLPEVARTVLVTDGEHISFGYTLDYENKDLNPWYVKSPCSYNSITHWMPMPELPKGMNNNAQYKELPQVKNHYVLTVHFSTNKSIDSDAGMKTESLLYEISNAIRKVFDLFHLEIRSSCLKTDTRNLEMMNNEQT